MKKITMEELKKRHKLRIKSVDKKDDLGVNERYTKEIMEDEIISPNPFN